MESFRIKDGVKQYDSIVIGSGQGGNPLAQRLAARGERVALVERKVLGGTCVNTGCTPTKMYVASAQVAHYMRNADRWGLRGVEPIVDMDAVIRRKNGYVLKSRGGWETTFAKTEGLDLYYGSARFTGACEVAVNGERLSGGRVFIDTGGTSTIPNLPGIDKAPYLTNETLLELTVVPEHLLILGGGYIGLEFSQIFRRFGAKVTVIEDSDQVLAHEDRDVADALQQALQGEGIDFELNERATSVDIGDTGSVTLQMASGKTLTGSHLLVAVGRTPNTKDLDVDKAGIALDEHGNIQVNDRLETSAPNVWALGDVKGGPAFTHISYNDFQIVFGNLFEGKSLRAKDRLVPYAVFTDPQLGRVGMTEKQARAEGRAIKVGKVPMTRVARAIERSETNGLMKLVVDAHSDQILGAAILSIEGGETVQILSTLMLAKQPYTLLKGAIYIHPTLAEGFFGLMESVK